MTQGRIATYRRGQVAGVLGYRVYNVWHREGARQGTRGEFRWARKPCFLQLDQKVLDKFRVV